MFAHATAHYGKPEFRHAPSGRYRREPHKVILKTTVLERPFGDLLRFRVEGTPADRPRLLIVAPMSGHYATLLRGTVERMVESYEVFITDWADAKMVPADAGKFDLDDYIDYLIDFAEHIHAGAGGQRIHMMAVCQPSVPAFAATCADEPPQIAGHPGHPHHDGRADRHPRMPHCGQQYGDAAPDRMVPPNR